MSPQQSPLQNGFDPSAPLTNVLARPNPLPASLATTQPVARRQHGRKRPIEPKQRWLLAAASAAALAVWAAFGLLYVKRYGAPDSLKSFISSDPQSVSISLSPPAGGAKAAAEEETVTVEMIPPKAEAAQVAPARAAAAPARPTPPTAEAPVAAPEPTARAAAATPEPAARPAVATPEPAVRAAAPTGRARVDEKPSVAKQRPSRPRQPADKATPKRRPIDEGF